MTYVDPTIGLHYTASGPHPEGLTNALSGALQQRRFFLSIEYIPSCERDTRTQLSRLEPIREHLQHPQLEVASIAVTDRVCSREDPGSINVGRQLAAWSGYQPLIHLSGKGCTGADLAARIDAMGGAGLQNALIISGDRLPGSPQQQDPYLDSVSAVAQARTQAPDLLIAVALNPFKYQEEDCLGQYLKLGKKVAAGADLAVTQIGWDPSKHLEALAWVGARPYDLPLMANLMPLTARRARHIRHHRLPGVVVPDSLIALLEDDESRLPDQAAARVYQRLALQVVLLKRAGYAGIQLTAVDTPAALTRLREAVCSLESAVRDRHDWNEAWRELMTRADGRVADPVPVPSPFFLGDGTPLPTPRGNRPWKLRLSERVHQIAFGRGAFARLLAAMLRPLQPGTRADTWMAAVERQIKGPLYGCQNCGTCRLHLTHFICPETCPKGLANGPCGGTSSNRCEFGDRECVHSQRYRLARDAAELEQLETWIIPAVPPESRGRASWPAHFQGRGPAIEIRSWTERPRVHGADAFADRRTEGAPPPSGSHSQR
ncbi:methylenetetrahydrofolate reductase C-terminal domain-containing protein [Thioalkalivibrio sp.]|uniref:methylenetetrahydrofolate reductase C-terminal domain-containing protein n=1 Tax=Thioalkalivibrio sp. TaxID=2093813 RepID=UPI003567DA51